MVQGLTGWHFVIIFYVVVLAVLAVALYWTIRLAVTHALRAHRRWLDQRAAE